MVEVINMSYWPPKFQISTDRIWNYHTLTIVEDGIQYLINVENITKEEILAALECEKERRHKAKLELEEINRMLNEED